MLQFCQDYQATLEKKQKKTKQNEKKDLEKIIKPTFNN